MSMNIGLFVAVGLACGAFAIGCDGGAIATPPQSSSDAPPGPDDAGLPAPPTPSADPTRPLVEGSATGLCTDWRVSNLDLAPLPSPQETSDLAAWSDGRGGMTVLAFPKGASPPIASAITPTGEKDGSLQLPPPPADTLQRWEEVLAAPNGRWVGTSWQSDAPSIVSFGADGAVEWTQSVTTPWAVQLGVMGDGTIGYAGSGYYDGSTADFGWIPADGGDAVTSTGYAEYGDVAYFDGRFYAASTFPSPSITIVSKDAAPIRFPGPTKLQGNSAVDALVGGADGESATLMQSTDDGAGHWHLHFTFAQQHVPIETYALDQDPYIWAGGATRKASNGLVFPWSPGGETADGGVPVYLAEVAPNGTRGPIVTLGKMVVAPYKLAFAGSADGNAFLVIAWNAGVRSSWLVRCAS